ncbi:3-oxoacyl-ACP synthase [candidate division WOR-1 bacterium RIFOXYB2_FULL_42_35]|uniref:Beta-ketoacyl-[acyl-carrier-protein] synthase III n=1 Tax=candidate division WOR-1 bacterium RIFOXYC2_FULL_41_25 TaxID=1802586 RepID=A0A1F4TR68_UNCSA|nr:MAG: 3-oxoacyl-ACP synthase [candidate division WOR-1 bacterium RIFOXYA2_FULL_41_14]OGC25792.1 MAG: 3-oxoacyl-ACP synthase [candidate division WOR-1 bacterium RIFOXYB2_FULL_42_35]OGC35232.1 MAG: 3-oxoacyl-ACP synthase [candidate division WOR-1 bacterium RIFOXYC2_FULL_41_25]OGC42855.1 MAG: 3-oxoacyl-ACP synthase [candidate division WOR-1 bacterium RIFOXYD2_FULL_41_8]
MRAKIIGVGSCVPEKVVTNHELTKTVDTSDEWIRTRTGIQERRLSDEATATSDLAIVAAERALAKANLSAQDLDLIIVGTTTPDTLFPSVACILQGKLSAVKAAAFDVSAACSGFNFALTTATQFIENGLYKNVLVIGADTLTKYVDWNDRGTCVLFGDGAGAVVLTASDDGSGVLASWLKAEGHLSDKLIMPGGGSRDPGQKNGRFITMDGKNVFKFATRVLEESILAVLKKANLETKDIDLLIPHQANSRIISHVVKKMDLPNEKVFVNLHKYGNTSAASIPIALDEAFAEGIIKAGDIVVLSGFGAGLTCGANIIKW